MNNRKQALIDLRDKVKEGEYTTTFEYEAALGEWQKAHNARHGYLDAAKALHEAVLPKKMCLAGLHQFRGKWGVRLIPGNIMVNDDNPARAWLLAILEALIAQEGE